MKPFVAGALCFGAISVVAQSSSGDIVYVTEYYSAPCTATGYSQTVMGTITQTYCPECEGASSLPASGGVLTTYTTAFVETCSTGTQMQTYTITEPCPTPGQSLPSDHVPQGYTVTTVSCPVCATPGPLTITTPIASPPAPTDSSAPLAGPPAIGASPPVSISPASGGASPPGGHAAPAAPSSFGSLGAGSAPSPPAGGSPPPAVPPPVVTSASPFSAPGNQSIGAAATGAGSPSTPNAISQHISPFTGSALTALRTPWDLLAMVTLIIPVIYIL
ncbi:hypothetical protein MMC14_007430 [Varicellaria rhodocarpa]|nr:hypothetical protein [Varicellaria rhodocarpa]